MTTLPDTHAIRLDLNGPVLTVWLNLPESKNPLTLETQREIIATFRSIADDRSVRIVIIRGAGGTFSAGGNLKAFAAAAAVAPEPGAEDPLRADNRHFGTMMEIINEAPQAVICVVEGHALGGGFGLACVGDVTIARDDAVFGLSEVTLGLVPASISPFVVQRIGLTAARRFGVSGARLSGREAVAVGIAHLSAATAEDLERELAAVLKGILRCAPGAVAETKRLLFRAAGPMPMGGLLDLAADSFCAAVRSPEGQEGIQAFLDKRRPSWTPVS